jgi:hypothetical protein
MAYKYTNAIQELRGVKPTTSRTPSLNPSSYIKVGPAFGGGTRWQDENGDIWCSDAWWLNDPNLHLYPEGQPELGDLMQANPAILHDKRCPCYPRRPRILCTCGLYEILLAHSEAPIPPNYGQVPQARVDGCGPDCLGCCEAVLPKGDGDENWEE